VSTISVVVVSWNCKEYLRDCLASIREAGGKRVCELIVVDNASSDGSADMVEAEFPEAVLIRASTNLGFARANNIAMRRGRGSLFALVNSDAIVHSGCLDVLANFLESNPGVGLVGPRIIGRDGRLQRTCRRLPTLWNTTCRALALDRILGWHGLFSGYEVSAAQHECLRQAEVLSGCFLLARRAAVEQVGYLDESFFFYGEDIDWCKRFADQGWKIVFVPWATATHFGGGSTSKAPLRYSIEILRATLEYWRKHHGAAGQMMCRALLVMHHAVRLLPRTARRYVDFGRWSVDEWKLQEDKACLQWLVMGTEVEDAVVPKGKPARARR
jgi:GT2 family glycosyltransferase